MTAPSAPPRRPTTPRLNPLSTDADWAHFDLNLLRVLDAVLFTGGVSAAAARLGLSQPATSAALARLRTALGDPLLVRHGNRMQRTPLGEELTPRISRIVDNINATLGITSTFDPTITRRCFRIGTTDYTAEVLMPALVHTLHASAPDATLEIYPCNQDPFGALATRMVDLIVADAWCLRGHHPVQRLFHERFSVIARADHPRLPTTVDLESYLAEGHVLVSPCGHVPGNVDQGLQALQRSRRVAATVPYFRAAVEIVACSDWILTLPQRIAASLRHDTRLRHFPAPLKVPGFDVVCAIHPRGQHDAPIAWLQTLVAQVGHALPRGHKIVAPR